MTCCRTLGEGTKPKLREPLTEAQAAVLEGSLGGDASP